MQSLLVGDLSVTVCSSLVSEHRIGAALLEHHFSRSIQSGQDEHLNAFSTRRIRDYLLDLCERYPPLKAFAIFQVFTSLFGENFSQRLTTDQLNRNSPKTLASIKHILITFHHSNCFPNTRALHLAAASWTVPTRRADFSRCSVDSSVSI